VGYKPQPVNMGVVPYAAAIKWFSYISILSALDGWKLDTNPMVVMGILEHENKMSVLNFVLRRTLHHNLPIKAKVYCNSYGWCPLAKVCTLGATYISYWTKKIFSPSNFLSTYHW